MFYEFWQCFRIYCTTLPWFYLWTCLVWFAVLKVSPFGILVSNLCYMSISAVEKYFDRFSWFTSGYFEVCKSWQVDNIVIILKILTVFFGTSVLLSYAKNYSVDLGLIVSKLQAIQWVNVPNLNLSLVMYRSTHHEPSSFCNFSMNSVAPLKHWSISSFRCKGYFSWNNANACMTDEVHSTYLQYVCMLFVLP